MRKWIGLLAAMLLVMLLFPSAREAASAQEPKRMTLMVYMCGSNLETENNSASSDMEEMMTAGIDPESVNVVLMTGGSTFGNWQNTQEQLLQKSLFADSFSFVPKSAPTKRNMGEVETLRGFIADCVKSFPAESYALILWDHGNGPVGEICQDECFRNDGLTLAELVSALEVAPLPDKLEWIGFDACLMGSAEVAAAVAPYARYMIASQEKEPPTGWNYSFLRELDKDYSGAVTGRRIIDAYIDAGAENFGRLTLSCVDLSQMEWLSNSVSFFFRPLSGKLNRESFPAYSQERKETRELGKSAKGTGGEYDLVDLGDLVRHYEGFGDSYQARSLETALARAVVYSRSSDGSTAISGLSIYHPLFNAEEYLNSRRDRYAALNFSPEYKQFLDAFGDILTREQLADWDGIALSDDGLGENGENCFSLKLTSEQIRFFSSAQLLIMGSLTNDNETAVYGGQLAAAGTRKHDKLCYTPVWIEEAGLDGSRSLSATYQGRCVYLTDAEGKPLAGPIAFELDEDGETLYVFAEYRDETLSRYSGASVKVMFTCIPEGDSGELRVVNAEVYDSVTKTYTSRLSFSESDYTHLLLNPLARFLPEDEELLPGFERWDSASLSPYELELPLNWGLRVIDGQLSGTQLYAVLQITDVQQNSYCTAPVPIPNPYLNDIAVRPRVITEDDYELTVYAMLDDSHLNPGLSIGLRFFNRSAQTLSCEAENIVLNGTRSVRDEARNSTSLYQINPGESAFALLHFGKEQLLELTEISELSFDFSWWPINQYQSDSETTCRYTCVLDGTQMKAFGSGITKPLAEVTDKTLTWQLLELHRTQQGNLSCLLHVINNGDRYAVEYLSPVLNENVQMPERFFFWVDAHTDCYKRIEINNSVQETFSSWEEPQTLGLGYAFCLERSGVSSIQSLRLFDDNADVSFALSEPFLFAPPEIVARIRENVPENGKGLLLDGEIRISAEQIAFGEKEIVLLLRVQNETDQDREISLYNFQINGDTKYLSSLVDLDRLSSAYSESVFALHISDVEQRKISELAFSFRCDDFTSQRSRIHFPEPVTMGTEGGLLLAAEAFETTPVGHGNLEGDFSLLTPLDCCEIAVTPLSENYSSILSGDQAEGVRLSLAVQITNRTESSCTYELDDMVVNGHRLVSTSSYRLSRLEPGQSGGGEWGLNLEGLANLEEIHAISCKLTVTYPDDAYREEVFPLEWTVSGCKLREFVEQTGEPLAASSFDGITVELMRLEQESGGNRYGTISYYGVINALFRVRNDSTVTYTYSGADILCEGLMLGHLYTLEKIPPQHEAYFNCTFSNAAEWSGYIFNQFNEHIFDYKYVPYKGTLLPCSGTNAIIQLQLIMETREKEAEEKIVVMTLSEPFVLLGTDEEERNNLQNRKILLDGESTVSVSYLIVGSNGLALTLSMTNNTDHPLELGLCDARADGIPLTVDGYKADSYTLWPGATEVHTVAFLWDEGTVVPAKLQELQVNFTVDGQRLHGASIRTVYAMLPGSGTVYDITAIETDSTAVVEQPEKENPWTEKLSFEFGFVKLPTVGEQTLRSGFQAAPCYADEILLDELVSPAVRITNHASEDVRIDLSADIDDELMTWDRVILEGESNYFFYLNRDWCNHNTDSYSCTYYLNGEEVLSGILAIREKQSLPVRGELLPGDLVQLGAWEQDADPLNGAEPIEWLVLEVRDDCALVVSRYALDSRPFHSEREAISWEGCELRAWLNESFYGEAFSQADRMWISPREGDSVFLLSYDEATQLLAARGALVCEGTANCGARMDSDDNCWWWLRSSAAESDYALVIDNEGSKKKARVNLGGSDGETRGGVRPAMWLALDGGLTRFGHYDLDGNPNNGKESLEWLILEEREGKRLLLSRYVIDLRPDEIDGTGFTDDSWENSRARVWLNGPFLDAAFSEAERNRILMTETDNSMEQGIVWTTTPCLVVTELDRRLAGEGALPTLDHVFLLSIAELERYFPAAVNRPAYHIGESDTAVAYGTAWALRSPGSGDMPIAAVDMSGYVMRAVAEYIALRPVIWVRSADSA